MEVQRRQWQVVDATLRAVWFERSSAEHWQPLLDER